MSAQAIQAVIEADIAPPAVKCVALVLAWHCHAESGHAWPSVGTLARECSMSESHVKRALGALKKQALLLVVKGSAGGTHRATTTYAFDMDRMSSDSVRRGTGSAGGRGSPATPDGVRRRALPRPPANPKIDEREPSALLSSKDTRAAETGQDRCAAPPFAAVATTAAHAAQAKTKTEQPLPRVDSTRPAADWRWTHAGIIARGIQMGLPSFDLAVAQGAPSDLWKKHMLLVLNADADAASRARQSAKRSGAAR